MENEKLQCVELVGLNWGNHILMPFGITLCGMPTVTASLKRFPQLKNKAFEGLIYRYELRDWDITCVKCQEMFSIIQNKSNQQPF